MSKKDDMIKEVYEEKAMKSLLADMTPEDKVKVDAALDEFVELFAVPLVDCFERVANDPEAIAELKRQLAKTPKVVVKKA